jgi:uncharacterized protein YjiS (DUF1127 family)
VRTPLPAFAARLTVIVPAMHAVPATGRRASPARLRLAARCTTLRTWIENRATRRRLESYQRLDPRFVKDVGLTRAQIATECSQPFWAAVGLWRGQ